jgi:hypothetical protein
VALAAIAAQVQDSLERLRASTTGSPMTLVHLSQQGDQVEPDE